MTQSSHEFTTPILELQQISYQIEGRRLIDGLSLSLKAGEIVCLLGASGCGKTTVLRLIAGLLRPSAGRIEIAGECVEGEQYLPAQKRNIGFVFQDYALFPHMTVKQNVEFGLASMAKGEVASRVQECLALVELQDFQQRYPHELSGGQQQRVAVARALAPKPNIVLMDEPFSNIDAHLKESIISELKRIFKAQNITVIFVTHSEHEADLFADRSVRMESGQLMESFTG